MYKGDNGVVSIGLTVIALLVGFVLVFSLIQIENENKQEGRTRNGLEELE